MSPSARLVLRAKSLDDTHEVTAAHVETARAGGELQIGDEGVRLRLLEAIHSLQRAGEGLGFPRRSSRCVMMAHAGFARTLTFTVVATATVR